MYLVSTTHSCRKVAAVQTALLTYLPYFNATKGFLLVLNGPLGVTMHDGTDSMIGPYKVTIQAR